MYIDIDDADITLEEHMDCLEDFDFDLTDIGYLLHTVKKIIKSTTDIKQEYLDRVFEDLEQTVKESSETA